MMSAEDVQYPESWRTGNRRLASIIVVLLIALAAGTSPAAELRLKTFAATSWLDESDIQARMQGDQPVSGDAELRYMTEFSSGALRGQWHHGLTWQVGDDVAFATAFEQLSSLSGGDGLRRAADDDDSRLLDLAGTMDRGNRHRLTHRVDRLNLQMRGASWSVVIGREALSLGGGILFHPMDFLSPFSPTAVDRDYKVGEDLLRVHRQMADGSELSLLAVGRRDENGDISRSAASFAVHGRGQIGSIELEGLVAEHRDDFTAGLGLGIPAGEAMLRSDLVVARVDGDWSMSGTMNLDRSFEVAGRNVYGFVEYYHNGFGVRRLEPGKPLPAALETRISHGELHTLMRNYVGAGAMVQWHPLIRQTLNVVRNLDDGSMFLQGSMQVDLSDSQNLEAGLLVLAGEAGEEFGGKPVALVPSSSPSGDELITAGSGVRFWLRWTWFPDFAFFNQG